MAAGKLRHRLFLEAPVETPDGSGGVSISWTMQAALWGEVRPRRSNERTSTDAQRTHITHRITVRHRTDVRPQMRFTHGTKTYRITGSFDPDGRSTWLACDAVEEVPGQ